MTPLEKDELFQNLRGFLQGRGIDLKEGAYSQAVQTSCHLLSEAINLSQQGIERAKDQFDKQMDQMRQFIHEKTAPKPPPSAPPPAGHTASGQPRSTRSRPAKAAAKPSKPHGPRRRRSTARKGR